MAADGGGRDADRIQEILAGLIKQRLRVSLERVEAALARWRKAELGPFEAHAEVLAHVAPAPGVPVMAPTLTRLPSRYSRACDPFQVATT